MPIPVVALGLGAVVLGGTALVLRKKKLKASRVPEAVLHTATAAKARVTPAAKAAPIAPTASVAQVAAKAQGLPVPFVPVGAPTMADLAASLADPAHNKVSFDSLTDEQLNAAQDALNAQKAAAPVTGAFTPGAHQAVVTTKDPSPMGDLIVRDAPNATATQIGGADKNGIVTLLNPDAAGDGVWAEVQWSGGVRPAVRGFSRKAFLKLV